MTQPGLRLFELAGADGRLFSPACWRSRLAMHHLGLQPEYRSVGFSDIGNIAPGLAHSVPVLIVGEEVIADSWEIAAYLHGRHDPGRTLFGGSQALSAFVQHWSVATLMPLIFRMIVSDIHAQLRAEDQDYFRASRERRLGQPLEQAQADREHRLPRFRTALDPLRLQLDGRQWLSGDQPAYADYLLLALFHWPRSTSDYRLLARDDSLWPWLNRGDDLFDGLLGRQPRFW